MWLGQPYLSRAACLWQGCVDAGHLGCVGLEGCVYSGGQPANVTVPNRYNEGSWSCMRNILSAEF